MKKLQKGYTLVELLLVIAIIAIMSVGIYSYYSKKAEQTKVANLTNTLKVIDNQVKNSYTSITDFGTLNNAYAIAAHLFPADMVSANAPNVVTNTFGGTFTLASAIFNGINGYSVTMDNLPNSVCTQLATTTFARQVQQISINGSLVKDINSIMSPAQVAGAATACSATQNKNILVLRNDRANIDLDPANVTSNRNKEQPQYISEVYTSSPSGLSGSCGGGSTWTGSFCSCPVNTEWSGSACVAFGTATPQPGACQRGQGWTPGTHTCVDLPYGSSTNLYSNGKNVPGNITTPVGSSFPVTNPTTPDPQHVIDVQNAINTLPATNVEVIDGRTIVTTRPTLKNNGMTTYLSSCVNGYFDTNAQRCIPN